MQSRREFLQLASITAMLIGSSNWNSVAAKQQITENDLLKFDAKGQITLLHLTDIHGQLKPVYFRPPSENFGIGKYEGIPPHLVGKTFLDYFGIAPNTPLAYAHTMLDYVPLAREYGQLGGLDRTASLIKKIRAERGEDKVLLLDGGDTWQGSYTSLKTQGEDMLEAMKLLKPDAMVGNWEFTLGQERLNELIEKIDFPFLGGNVFDTEWDEPVNRVFNGKKIQGRRTKAFGTADFEYAGRLYKPVPWTQPMKYIKGNLETFIRRELDIEVDFKFCLCGYYGTDGKGIPHHSDTVPTYNDLVVSLSFGAPRITKDGVTVANSIMLKNPVENLGVAMMKQAAQQTANIAGDGTTTSIVLAQAIIGCYKAQNGADFSFRDIRSGIDKYKTHILKILEDKSIKITEDRLNDVSTISANNDKVLGKLIADAFREAGDNGIVAMETSPTSETYVDTVEGTKLNSTYKTHHFYTNKEKEISELDNPLVFISASDIPNVRKIQDILEYAIKSNRSILLIAPLESQPLTALAMNMVKGNIKVNVIDPPSFGPVSYTHLTLPTSDLV